MSWDIIVQEMPADARCIEDIPEDFSPGPIGSRSEIIAGIKSVVPEANFSDPSWGLIDGPDYSIEVNIGDKETISNFAFHVRGGDAATGVIADILSHLNLRAFDTSTGEFFDPETAAESLRNWRAYRDRIARKKT